jgi:hypothetical protein
VVPAKMTFSRIRILFLHARRLFRSTTPHRAVRPLLAAACRSANGSRHVPNVVSRMYCGLRSRPGYT